MNEIKNGPVLPRWFAYAMIGLGLAASLVALLTEGVGAYWAASTAVIFAAACYIEITRKDKG